MIKSMTGYGKAEGMIGQRKYVAEIRALNSKQFDLSIRMPSAFKEKEMKLRSLFGDKLVRGKIDLTIYFEAGPSDKKVVVNKSLMESYYNDFKEVAESFGQDNVDYMGLMIRIPDVLKQEKEELDENEWSQIMVMVEGAMNMLDQYRMTEGKKLEDEFERRIKSIQKLHDNLDDALARRVENIKNRIQTNLDEFLDPEKIDSNRFEQEMIYYLEKLDVSEERSRLNHNCDYFLEVLQKGESQGKKLGFISQEIGREINTMGSKANDSDVQRSVVKMKDELEKIKEQVLNAL